ncbi:MAG: hypothetical protein JST00_20040 [Deltaproteobacteria bacterium]|nr:hypothetical protein [Deltaproteobacteria bacterium]
MTSFADRQRAHEARLSKINADADAKIAAARAALAAAQTEQAANVAKAAADFDAATAAADEALAAETLPQLIKAARAFPSDERGASAEVAALWREVDARTRREVGAEPSEHILALAFCYAHSEGAAARAAGLEGLNAGAGSAGLLDAAHAIHKAATDGSGPAEVRAACAAMELAVERFAKASAIVPDVERLRVIERCMTHGRYLAKRDKYDKQKAARDLAAVPNVKNGGRIVT